MSLVTRRRRAYLRQPGAPRLRVRLPAIPHARSGPVVACGVALAIVLCAFGARGGSQLERTAWTQVCLMLAAGLLLAAALIVPRSGRTPERIYGAWTVAAFALLAVYTALSISWSLTPGESWLEANRTFAYLAALAGGVALGRLVPGRWGALLHALGISAVVICGWAVATKVFPAALAPDELFARLRPPFEYWNSVGLAAALGVPPMLWLACRRSGYAPVNALAWPALGILTVALMLAYSRGALVALVVGLALWFALVPLRLRAAVVLGSVLVTVIPIVAWAFTEDGLSRDGPPMALRVDAGQELGALLLLMVVALTIAGLAAGFLGAVRPASERTRARASRTLLGTLLAVPAVAVLMLANAPGGIDGQISKAWKQAVDPKISAPSNSPSRLTQTSSVRARYWQEAVKVHDQSAWIGTGAGSYGTLRLRYRINQGTVRHVHGYPLQTLADLGWLGVGLSLLVTGAWLFAAARVVGVRPRDRRLPWDAERVGLATIAVLVIVFGVHSTIDWTWYVPGNAIPALLCAGWVASRPPLRDRLGLEAPPAGERISPRRYAFAGVVGLVALLAAWSTLQPVRSADAQDAAYEHVDKGDLEAAVSSARTAHRRNPLAIDPLFELASMELALGNNDEARKALEKAVDLEPANPETWRRLGRLRLNVLGDAKSALRAFQAAYFLDPHSRQAVNDVVIATRVAQG